LRWWITIVRIRWRVSSTTWHIHLLRRRVSIITRKHDSKNKNKRKRKKVIIGLPRLFYFLTKKTKKKLALNGSFIPETNIIHLSL
jgi:hypothetical protein